MKRQCNRYKSDPSWPEPLSTVSRVLSRFTLIDKKPTPRASASTQGRSYPPSAPLTDKNQTPMASASNRGRSFPPSALRHHCTGCPPGASRCREARNDRTLGPQPRIRHPAWSCCTELHPMHPRRPPCHRFRAPRRHLEKIQESGQWFPVAGPRASFTERLVIRAKAALQALEKLRRLPCFWSGWARSHCCRISAQVWSLRLA